MHSRARGTHHRNNHISTSRRMYMLAARDISRPWRQVAEKRENFSPKKFTNHTHKIITLIMKTERNDLDMRRFGRTLRRNWWLYAVALVILLGLAATYAVVRMPVYTSHAAMLIENNTPDASALAGGKAASAMRLFAISSGTVSNEIYLINSNDVLSRTVRRCGLNTTFVSRDGLKKAMIYPESAAPVAVELNPAVLDTLPGAIKVTLSLHNGKADIKATSGFMNYRTECNVQDVSLPYTVRTRYCRFKIVPTAAYDKDMEATVDIHLAGTQSIITALRKKLQIGIDDKTADAIVLEIDDDKHRGGEILNVIMDEYNTKRLERTRETALMERDYCNDRLNLLLGQLSESEEKVERFKRDNNLMAMAIDSAGWMGRALGSRAEIARKQNELTYYDQVLYTLNHDKANNTFLPASLDGQVANPLITEYNDLVAEKRELQRSATDENPSLKSINDRLGQMRHTITTNFSQIVDVSKRNLSTMYDLRQEATGNMAKFPALERELFNLMRDKTIKNELYLYLLQRREAAELKLSSPETMGFIIDKSWTDVKPSPNKTYLAVAVALILALLAPTIFLFIIMRRRDELREPMDTAFIGLEDNTVSGTVAQAARGVRTMLLAHPQIRTLYVADTTQDSLFLNAVGDSLMAIGRKVEETLPPDKADNDLLLSTDFQNKLNEAAERNTISLVPVPDSMALHELASLVDADSAMLLVVLRSNAMRRSRLRRMLRGQQPTHVMVAILPRK